MNYITISKLMESVKPGSFTRLTYKSEMPLTKEFKSEGYRVEKITSITTRFKISYNKLKSYKAPEKSSTRKNPYTTLVSNLFYSCGDKKYISTYPISKGANKRTAYIVTYPNGDKRCLLNKNDISKFVKPASKSALKSTNYMKINIDNIISINGKEV